MGDNEARREDEAEAPRVGRRLRPRTPAEADDSRADKARRILDAAVEVFAEKGFFNATVAEVARRAGVADGTIYLYFKGKDDLLIRLFEEIMAAINRELREAVRTGGTSTDKLREVARAQAELVLDNPALAEVICVELRQSAKFMKEYDNPGFRTYLTLLTEIIGQGQRDGELRRTIPAHVAARTFFGALDELHLSWCLAKKRRFDLPATSREVTETFVRGLACDPEETRKKPVTRRTKG